MRDEPGPPQGGVDGAPLVTLIMPMAGLGSRFQAAGERLPKPIIPVLGVPMFRLALAAARCEAIELQAISVVLAHHQMEWGIADLLTEADPALRVVTVAELTRGALETCLAAEPFVTARESPLIVMDCDLTFDAPGYFALLRAMASGADEAAGLLLSFCSNSPRFSYAAVEDGRVIKTAEKRPISNRALIGVYGFRSAEIFFRTAHDIVARNQREANGEFFVSSVYNSLINDGGLVKIVDAEQYWSTGTPEELAAALASQEFIKHVCRLKRNVLGLEP